MLLALHEVIILSRVWGDGFEIDGIMISSVSISSGHIYTTWASRML